MKLPIPSAYRIALAVAAAVSLAAPADRVLVFTKTAGTRENNIVDRACPGIPTPSIPSSSKTAWMFRPRACHASGSAPMRFTDSAPTRAMQRIPPCAYS